MRKLLICALALGGFAASAQAADLSVDSLKDPLPDTISFAGITAYGTIDIGGAYQQYGYGYSPYWGNALQYQPTPANMASTQIQKNLWTGNNNALSQSSVGLKIEQSLGQGFAFIGKAETGFNPISLEIANGAKARQRVLQQGSGLLDAASDSSRNGQFLNGEAYFGFSNASYGTLTFGRQNTFLTSALGTYDPNKGSAAFSLIGNSGTVFAGAGNTEDARWDEAIKYVYQYGPAHAGVMYAPGGNHTQLLGYGVGANAGVTYKGASVDGYYTKQNGGVNLDAANGLAGSPFTNSFKYTISNNEAWGGAAKYGFDLGGGFKDEPSSKVTLFAGYVHITTSNADKAQDAYLNEQTSGDLSLALANKFSPYESNRIIQTEWFGASYETGPWALTATWYRENQNTYLSKATSASTAINNNGGDVDWVSGVVDYKFNKHFDVYAGVTWVGFTGDWATGQAHTDDVTVASGVRLKF